MGSRRKIGNTSALSERLSMHVLDLDVGESAHKYFPGCDTCTMLPKISYILWLVIGCGQYGSNVDACSAIQVSVVPEVTESLAIYCV